VDPSGAQFYSTETLLYYNRDFQLVLASMEKIKNVLTSWSRDQITCLRKTEILGLKAG
jgi:hypothetical protein